jgi:hypothetical protein
MEENARRIALGFQRGGAAFLGFPQENPNLESVTKRATTVVVVAQPLWVV